MSNENNKSDQQNGGKNAFADLALEGMIKYNDRNAEAHKLKRAAELDERIRAFAEREKNESWIREAEDFCSREELANKDISELSKEFYRLSLIREEARGLAELAERERLEKIAKESREKQAMLEAEAEEKLLRDKLSREERERSNRQIAEEFDNRINLLASSAKTKYWQDEVEKANEDASKLSTDIKLLVKNIDMLDTMLGEARKLKADAIAAENKRLADEAREIAEREATLAKIENDKRVAKAMADAEEARIKAEREAREVQEKAEREIAEARVKAEREAEEARIANEKRIAQEKADAEAARIKADREAQEKLDREIAEARAKAAREAEEARIANEKRIAQEKADAEAARIRAEREAREAEEARIANEKRIAQEKADAEAAKIRAEREAQEIQEKIDREIAEAKAKAAREAEEARIANEKRIAQEKADAEAAFIRAEREAAEAKARAEAEARAREDARIRREAEEQERLAKIAAEAKEKELRERLGREESERRDKESARDMDDLIAKLSDAPRTKLWIAEVRKAYAAAEAMTTDAKLMVAKLADLEAVYSEANGRDMAFVLDNEISALLSSCENIEWARNVVKIRNKLDGGVGVRDEACVGAKPYMEKLQALYDMCAKTGPIIADDEKKKAKDSAKRAARNRREAVKQRICDAFAGVGTGILSVFKRIGKIGSVFKRKKKVKHSATYNLRRASRGNSGLVNNVEKPRRKSNLKLKTVAAYAFAVSAVIACVLLSIFFTNHINWIVPAAVALALLALDFGLSQFERLTLPISIVAIITGIVFLFVPSDGSLASVAVVMGAYVFLQWSKKAVISRTPKYDERGRLTEECEYEKNLQLLGIALGGILAWVGLCVNLKGAYSWVVAGVAFAVFAYTFVIMAHLNDVESVVLKASTIILPIITIIFASLSMRLYVFSGLMAASGYLLGHLTRLLIGLANGKSYTDVFSTRNYFTASPPIVSTIMVIILSIVFSGTGIEDFIIDEDGVLQETYCTDQTLIVPDGVVKIASGAGRNMAMAVKLVIPEGVTEIGEKAFYGAHGLQAIYLPSTLERLDGDKLMAGSVSKKITVYFGGSRDRAEALGLADKITTVGDLSTFEEKFFNNGITQNCESIEFVYDVDYMEEFYKD